MHWVAWGVTALSAVGTESMSTAAGIAPGTPLSGRITDATLGPPDSVPGLAVLSVFLVVSLGLLRYRWTGSRDERASRETNDRGSAGVGTDGERSPADGVSEPDSPTADRDNPATGDTHGHTSGPRAPADTPERSVDGSVSRNSPAPSADGVATNGNSPPKDGAVDPSEHIGHSSGVAAALEADSDEERVLGMLETNDGSVKQARIVDETDWSKSKVSTLLSEMDENGTITKLRLGRENVIFLDGEEPELALSPDDERGPP